MDDHQEQLLQSALMMAKRGFRVFPLVPGSKTPAIEDWPNLATTDTAKITRVWSAAPYNIGVAMGGGWLGVDIDVKKGKQGTVSADALGVDWTRGFVVRTVSGGRHVYYRGPDVGNSAGRLGDGLDIRSRGGFLVGPGSVIDGVAYALEAADDPPEAPPGLVQQLVAPRERVADLPVTVTLDTPDAVDRAIDFLREAPIAVEGAHGDETTYKVAARLKDLGIGRDMAADLMVEHWNPRCAPPWSLDDLIIKVGNAYEYGTIPAGIASPAVDFAGVKVDPPAAATREPDIWFDHGDDFDPNQTWLYYQMLPTTGVAVVVGPSNSGKTFLELELARSGATGKDFFTVPPDERFGTLFVFTGTEGSGLALRMAALQEPDPLPISATAVGNLGERGALGALLEKLQAKAALMLEKFGVPVRLVVIETLAASGLLADENDNAMAAQAIANLGQISLAMNALVMTSHHPPKDGKGARGASAIPSNADYVIELERHGAEAVRTVRLTKARGAEQRQLGAFSLVPVTLGTDPKGRAITSMTVSMGETSNRATRTAPHADKLIEALSWAIMEADETVNGQPAASEAALEAAFRDRLGGSYGFDGTNKGKGAKLFREALLWCEQMGRIEVTAFAGQKFVINREVSHV